MILRILVIISFVILVSSRYCHADVLFRTDINPTQGGIQTSATFNLNDTFDVDIYLTITDSSSVITFGTSVQFDQTALVLESVQVPTRPTGYEQVSPLDSDSLASANASGIFERFDSLNLTELALNSGFDEVIGTLRFRAISAGTNLQISPLFVGGFDGVADSDLNMLGLGGTSGDGGVFFEGATLNINGASSVPEPGSIILAGGAIAGWLCQRRLRRRDSREKRSPG